MVAIFTTLRLQNEKISTARTYVPCYSVAVPHNIDADPNPTFNFDADPNPTFYYDANSAPTFHFEGIRILLLIKVMQIFDHWHTDSLRLHFDIASLHCERPGLHFLSLYSSGMLT